MSTPKRRHQAIPVLHTRGTHYEIGYDMGRTFSGMIREFLQVHTSLNKTLIPAYNTTEGTKLFNESLEAVKASFPQYILELEGIAQGAEVEFEKLFLLHLGDLLPHYVIMANFKGIIPNPPPPLVEVRSQLSEQATETAQIKEIFQTAETASNGCLNIVVNNYYNRYIAHTQDASQDMLNYLYFVVAHIVNEEPQGKHNVIEEKFLSLCYAGHLPGHAMSCNHHGLVYAVNKLTPSTVGIGRTPAHFLTRALLSAENMENVESILNDDGLGAADGFSLSIAYSNDRLSKCYIIEVAPAIIGATSSLLSIVEVQPGSHAYHANKYQELEIDEIAKAFHETANERLRTIANYDSPKTKEQVLEIASDEKIFIEGGFFANQLQTLMLGVFDLTERTLAVYIDRPRNSDPFLVIPLPLKCKWQTFES